MHNVCVVHNNNSRSAGLVTYIVGLFKLINQYQLDPSAPLLIWLCDSARIVELNSTAMDLLDIRLLVRGDVQLSISKLIVQHQSRWAAVSLTLCTTVIGADFGCTEASSSHALPQVTSSMTALQPDTIEDEDDLEWVAEGTFNLISIL